jgi:hypothetical protein
MEAADVTRGTSVTSAVGALIVVAVVALEVFPWHFAHKHVPEWDSAGFVLVAQKIAASFDSGLLSGLRAMYVERLWRPIIFPSFAAPFFLLTSGDILASVTLGLFTSTLVAALYVYFLLRDLVGWLRAAVGTTFVITLAIIANYAHMHFFAEPFWLAATAGTVFHLFRGYTARSRGHFIGAGVCLGVMFAVRPAETIVLAALPVCALLLWGYSSGALTAGDLLKLGAQIGAATAAVILKMFNGNVLLTYVLLAVAVTVVAWHFRRFFVYRPILGFLIVAEAVAVGWNLPSLRMLYDWAYAASFGDWAAFSDQRFRGMSLVGITNELLQSYSPRMLALISAVAAVWAAGWRRANSTEQPRKALAMVGVALLAILPMLILHLLSATSDERRIMPAMFLLYIGLSALALTPTGLYPGSRLLAVVALASMQIVSISANGFGIKSPTIDRIQSYTGTLRDPDPSPDQAITMIDGIESLGIRSGFVIAYSHCLLGWSSCSASNMRMFEHVAVSTIAAQRRLPINVHFFTDLDLSKPETLAEQIHSRGASYLLVDMFDQSDFSEVNHKNPFYVHTNTFVAFARNGFPPGFFPLGCFTTLGRPICGYAVMPVAAARAKS